MLKIDQHALADHKLPPPWQRTTPYLWDDWRWQIANRITTVEKLGQIINLTKDEKEIVGRSLQRLPAELYHLRGPGRQWFEQAAGWVRAPVCRRKHQSRTKWSAPDAAGDSLAI